MQLGAIHTRVFERGKMINNRQRTSRHKGLSLTVNQNNNTKDNTIQLRRDCPMLPTPMGMNRIADPYLAPDADAPHTRGDEPP
jgi:hypothetical protein